LQTIERIAVGQRNPLESSRADAANNEQRTRSVVSDALADTSERTESRHAAAADEQQVGVSGGVEQRRHRLLVADGDFVSERS
jgi:hypothetical protein